VLYVSHSTWESEDAFHAWTNSDAFKKAHRQSYAPKGTYLAHPDLETFHTVREE
jgi:heme-degrading monooxygenase HmoA